MRERIRLFSLTVTDPYGHWTLCRLFAIYVMPGDVTLDEDEATQRIESELEWVRTQAVGFLELPFDGYESHEGPETTFDIPLGLKHTRQ